MVDRRAHLAPGVRHRTSVGAALLCLVAASACPSSDAHVCGEQGRLCPPDRQCYLGRCVVPAQIGPCDGKAAGTACEYDGRQGSCDTAEVCVERGCGNGVVETGEVCDDGNTQDGDECRGDCRSDYQCGNGVVDVERGEACDCGTAEARSAACAQPNGNLAGAICRADCQRHCGDKQLLAGEVCDGVLLDGETCGSLGFYRGDLACNASCTFDTSGCSGFCGDGVIDAQETCDTAPPPTSCLSQGFDYGALACSKLCLPDTGQCGRIGWAALTQPSVGEHSAIWADGHGGLVVVGEGSRIVHFDGQLWTSRVVGGDDAPQLSAVWGRSPSEVYVTASSVAGGPAGRIYRFDGVSWAEMTVPENDGLLDIEGFASPTAPIYAVGSKAGKPFVARLENGVWTGDAAPPGTGALTGIAVLGSRVVAVGPSVGAFERGLPSWTPLAGAPSATWSTVWGRGANDYYIAGSGVGGRGAVARFDGTAWTLLSPPLGGVKALGGGTAFVVATDGTTLAFHYGSRWSETPPPDGLAVRAFARDDATDTVFSAGAQSMVHRFGGSTWVDARRVAIGSTVGGFGVVWSAGDTTHYINSVDRSHWIFDGETWVLRGNFAEPLWQPTDLWGDANGDALYALGSQAMSGGSHVARIYTFQENKWTLFSKGLESSPPLFAVWGDDAGGVYVAGDDQIFAVQQDAWQVVHDRKGARLRDLWGSSASDIWAAGEDLLLRFDGSDWSEVPVTGRLETVWGSSASNVWASGSGVLLRFDGKAWQPSAAPTMAAFSAMSGTGADDVFAVTGLGEIFHFEGATWASVRPPVLDIWGDVAIGNDRVTFVGAGPAENPVRSLLRVKSW